MLDRLGKFTLTALLGKGAMGEVYLAQDPQIGRVVAIKTIRADLAEGADVRERFRREAQAAGLLSHPNLVTVYEFGEQDGLLFLAMEYVEGQSLQALLAAKSLSRDDLLEILAQVCDGLDYAHRHGIVHRDVKPANVMVVRDDGRITAKVMDFGVARMAGSDLTETGMVMGTVSYMAPEYLIDGVASPASDQFAVGVMLCEGLIGRNPYRGETTGAVVHKIIHETDPLTRPEVAALDEGLQGILRTALARDPLGRFPSAADLARALRAARAGAGEELTTYLARASTRPTRRPGRSRWPWLLASAALAAVLLLGALAMPRLRAARDPQPQPAVPANLAGNPIVLDEAARLCESRPEDALRLAESVLAEEPGSAVAWALKLACLYRLDRMVDFGEALQAARDHAVRPADLLAVKAFKAVLERDREHRRLPEALRNSLLNP